ncbi:hypothetical protein QQS21_010731 [Conoideocrella luteorostrata]|uniref:Carrier domain-containing protein n=1 Tax=Conoideocrella luteorostrata TaxID=1105319 RepID=A0AAJ0CER9_9HYPO|nr:hypothetical protein QQS21_010731 [Conoideocrella luteorostrata]
MPMPTNIGERLLPSLVDQIAASDPDRVLYSVAKTKNPAEGFRDIDANTFAQAVDRCSWYLEENLGRGENFPTLLYMGPQDLVYAILTLACIKTGYKLLLNSPRNTLEAHLSLLEQMDCHIFLLPPQFPLPVVKQILGARQMRVLDIPILSHWLDDRDSRQQSYPYNKDYKEAKSEPFVVLHTSGSTGTPKPVVQTHGTHSPLDAFTALPSLGMKPTYPAMCAGTRVYLAFPLFHCAGIAMLLPGSIYSGFTVVLGPFPPSADVANSIHEYGNVQHSCLAPMTLVDLVKVPSHLENLSKLTQITFGGGPCPQAVGDLISSKTRLLNCLGTTECGVLPIQLCEPHDWAYMSVSPVLGHEYRHISGDLYEQVIRRDVQFQKYQGIFETFVDLEEWPMKDLYSKHPTEDNVWLYRGRTDDIIVFTTGEKLNPLEMESIIGANPAVGAVLVTGQGRFQSSLLVEPAEPISSQRGKESLLDALWPSVLEANKQTPSHGRIQRDMIIVTAEGKPMLRAGKGTVQRKMTVDLYATELNVLYSAAEDTSPYDAKNGNSMPIAGTDTQHDVSTEDVVKQLIAESSDIPVDEISTGADLFELGLDSLQVTIIVKKINKTLLARSGSQLLDARKMYSYPTISALSRAVSSLARGETLDDRPQSDVKRMQQLYGIHIENMPISGRPALKRPLNGSVILLTGSTGSLGSYILDVLLSSPNVSQIFCLNRGRDSFSRQKNSQSSKGLHPLNQKVKFLEANLSEPNFGLPRAEYKTILTQVTDIIHNAWQVNFNLSIESFATQIAGVQNMIEFAAHSTFGARICYISSVSAVGGRIGEVAEQIYTDWQTPHATGYGQSKFVAERLLDTAAREADVSVIVCRVGQVAGPTLAAGMWPKQEWLPSLIASSKYLGMLPESLGKMDTVDWIPVDLLGKAVSEIVVNSAENPGATVVYHATNSQRINWAKLVPTIAQCIGARRDAEIVPLKSWVEALQKSKSHTEDVKENPAIKLLDFFEDLVNNAANQVLLSTKNTTKASAILCNLEPIQETWMENWMKQWAL